jgi:MoaA/NifB/PqqE/SkfB family radical SAM enzyme
MMNRQDKIAVIKQRFPSLEVEKKIALFEARNPGHLFNVDALLAENPSFFTVRMGYACNERCIHCFTEDKKPSANDRSLDDLKKTVDETPPETTIIVITGGEPTVRPELAELLDYIRLRGYINNVQTNGVLLGDPEYFKEIAPYLDSLFIPVHSANPIVHDSITRLPGSWEKTMAGIRNLVNAGIYVNTNTVINRLNYRDLYDVAKMLQEIQPGMPMTFTFPHPVGAAASTHIVPRYTEVAPHLFFLLEDFGRFISTHYIPRCYLYPFQDVVTNVDDSDNGSVHKPGVDYINNNWERTDYGEYKPYSKIKTSKCRECQFDSICIGAWREYGELYGSLDVIPR